MRALKSEQEQREAILGREEVRRQAAVTREQLNLRPVGQFARPEGEEPEEWADNLSVELGKVTLSECISVCSSVVLNGKVSFAAQFWPRTGIRREAITGDQNLRQPRPPPGGLSASHKLSGLY